MSAEQLEQWHFYLSDEGEPEAVNSHTGEIATRELPVGDEIDDYTMVTTTHGKMWVPNGSKEVRVAERQYNSLTADRYCHFLLEGLSLIEACKKADISYYTLCKWRRLYPEFRDMVDQTKKDRAELLFEELLILAKDTNEDKDAVGLKRLQADIYKHLAAVGDDSFNPKTKLSVDQRVGIVSFETGIRRPGDPGYEEKEVFESIKKGQERIGDDGSTSD